MADFEMSLEPNPGIEKLVQPTVNGHIYASDVFQCGICGESFQSLCSFINHKIKHAASGQPVECSLCGRSYNQKCFLRDHYKKKHRVEFIEGQGFIKSNRKQVIDTPSNIETEEIVTTIARLEREEVAASLDTSAEIHPLDSNNELNTIHVVITKTNEDINNVIDVINQGPGGIDSGSLPHQIQDIAQVVNTQPLEEIPEPKILLPDTEIVIKSEPNNVTKPVNNNNSCTLVEEEDFHFIFMNNNKQGKKFSYEKHGFKCLHCDFKTSWRMSLCKHMSQNHVDMMAIHQYIEIKSPKLDSNQKLMRMSEYFADLRESKEKKKKFRGVEMQDRPGIFTCSKCDKVFNRLRYLRKHMETHKTESKFLCDECGKSFKTKNYLQAHRRTHKPKMFRCSQCSFSSSVNSLIHAHRQLHNHGSVLCDVCGQAYLDNSTLKKHKRVHDMSRPFGCTYPGCTWRFNKEVLCHAHVKSHTTTGQFMCNICEYSFRHKHHLQRHQQKLHGIPSSTSRSKKEDSLIPEKEHEEDSTVNFVIDSEQLESAIQQGNLVISSTDVEGNTVNYVTYHTLLEQDTIPTEPDAQTIVIPPSDCNQIIFQP